jgi:hypothetical protein
MRKSVPYEIIAAILMALGAVLLVVVWFPVINPAQYEMLSHQKSPPLARYLVGTPVALLVLARAWYFNRKARTLKGKRVK